MGNKAMRQERRADEKFARTQTIRLVEAFPVKEEGFYKVLVERILENNFTEEMLVRAIGYVIDNTELYQLSISSVIKAKQILEERDANTYGLHPDLRPR
jgi:hypothetical protein